MIQYVLKIVLSAAILVAVAELAKRSPFWAAVLASLPITSLLAFVWFYFESGDIEKVATLSSDIFWLVLPSLVLFIVLPLLLRTGIGFWLSLVLLVFLPLPPMSAWLKFWGYWVFAFSFPYSKWWSGGTGQRQYFCLLPSTLNIFRLIYG